MSGIEGLSTALASYSAQTSAQVKVATGASEQLEAVMATLLEGIESAATAGTSGGALLAIA